MAELNISIFRRFHAESAKILALKGEIAEYGLGLPVYSVVSQRISHSLKVETVRAKVHHCNCVNDEHKNNQLSLKRASSLRSVSAVAAPLLRVLRVCDVCVKCVMWSLLTHLISSFLHALFDCSFAFFLPLCFFSFFPSSFVICLVSDFWAN